MRRILPLLFLLVALVACFGFYRSWFQVSANKEHDGQKLDVHFQIDREKMIEDAKMVKEKTESLLNKDKAGD